MKRGLPILLCLFVAIFAFPSGLVAQENLSHTIWAEILVDDGEDAGQDLVQWVEDAGGYYTLRSLEMVRLRVPSNLVPDLRSELAAYARDLLSYNPSSSDRREERVNLEATITSREEALARLLEFVGEADAAGLVTFEREINETLSALETAKGRLRELENSVAYALVEVYFTTVGRSIPQNLPSSFAWLNTVGLERFLGGVRQ